MFTERIGLKGSDDVFEPSVPIFPQKFNTVRWILVQKLTGLQIQEYSGCHQWHELELGKCLLRAHALKKV